VEGHLETDPIVRHMENETNHRGIYLHPVTEAKTIPRIRGIARKRETGTRENAWPIRVGGMTQQG
jgi:hypothetical protein